MAVSFSLWLGGSDDLVGTPSDHEAERAVRNWRIIQDRPESIAFKKPDGTTLAAQSVRVEVENRASEREDASGRGASRNLIVFGVSGHPDEDIANTNIARGYRFIRNSREYRVIELVTVIGGIQAVAESVG